MKGLMMRSLLQGNQHYRNALCYRRIPDFGAKGIRSIRKVHSTQADERSEMMALWPDLVKDLTGNKLYSDIPEATKWMAEILEYNVPHGKLHRGLILIHSYRMLAHPDQLTEENLKLARLLAWCYEIGEAFLNMQDDLNDLSKTRNGQLCWHLRDNNRVTTMNDSIILEHASYQLLTTYFKKHECYLNLFELITKNVMCTVLGQVLDSSASNYGNKPNIDRFTMNRYDLITKYRGSLYFYLLPVKFAMYFAGTSDPVMYKQIEPILLDLGHFYIVQNDYLDSYGDPNVTGKHGTDIQTGKCSWLIVKALEHATPVQKKILQDCYGHDDPERVSRVKQVYDELDLSAIYANYEEKAYNSMKTQINQMTCNFPKELFDKLMMLSRDIH